MTNPQLPDEDAPQPEPRPGRRVYFVRLDRPQPGQGPHWIGVPAAAENPVDKTGSASQPEPQTPGRSAAQAPPTGTRTRIDSPQPLAATARPATTPAAATTPVTAPQAPVADDPLQTHARQLVAHLKARHRELRRRHRDLERRAAEVETRQQIVPVVADPSVAEHVAAEQQIAAERLQQRETELAEFALRLRQREEDLDRERTALDQMRAEVAARNQEALEMRLACEQLWSQLASRMEVPRLVESIAQLRRKLSDQYHGAALELAQQRDEVRQLVARLDDRHKQLRRQREEVQAWVMRRHEELEIQHIQLLKRQQELDDRERAQRQLHADVQQQIGDYQRKIRQLTAQLRCKQELSRLES